jgi:stage III sporulation protein AE
MNLFVYESFSYEQKDNVFLPNTIDLIEKGINNSFDNKNIKQVMPDFSIKNTLKNLISGDFSVSPQKVIKKVMDIFFSEVIKLLGFGLKIIGLLLIIGLINNLKSSFGNGTVSDIGFYCGYTILSLSIFSVVHSGIGMVMSIVKNSQDFIFSALPVLLGLMATSGQIASSMMIKPFYIMSIVFMFSLIQKVILPMMYFQTVIAFVSNITDGSSIKTIGDMNKKIVIWLIGGCMSIFVGVLTLQGSLGYSIDNVTAKTTKFTLNSMMPFVGKYISDATDTMIACSILLKNSAGIVATIIIVLLCIIPLIKAMAFSLIFKILGIVSDIAAQKRFSTLLNDISGVFFILGGIITTIVIMFYISICFVIGNVSGSY